MNKSMNEDWENFETICKLFGCITTNKSKAHNTLTILDFYLVEIIKCKKKLHHNHHYSALDYILDDTCILTIKHEKSKYNKNIIVRFIDKYNHSIPSKIHVLKYLKENSLL